MVSTMRPIIPIPRPRPNPDPKGWEVYTWPVDGEGPIMARTVATVREALDDLSRALRDGFRGRMAPAN